MSLFDGVLEWATGLAAPRSCSMLVMAAEALRTARASGAPRVARPPGYVLIPAVGVFVFGLSAMGPAIGESDQSTFAQAREQMIEVIQEHARSIDGKALDSEISGPVIQAMAKVPRQALVSEEYRDQAYEDRPLPIGYGQTISQPFVVALMTDLLDIGRGAKVLEVGTGSGYQAAVLAELGAEVYTIEIIPELGRRAARRLERIGYDGIRTRIGDGYYGWEEQAPFDGIIVTAAASHIPPPLTEQLKPGARMVIPVGAPFMVQQLVLVSKHTDGGIRTRQLHPVSFVPLARAP